MKNKILEIVYKMDWSKRCNKLSAELGRMGVEYSEEAEEDNFETDRQLVKREFGFDVVMSCKDKFSPWGITEEIDLGESIMEELII